MSFALPDGWMGAAQLTQTVSDAPLALGTDSIRALQQGVAPSAG
jgi:hypothetical protein